MWKFYCSTMYALQYREEKGKGSIGQSLPHPNKA